MRTFVTSPMGIASLLVAALLVLYLLTAYGSYLIALAPLALLLVCPLMMLFMMRGHNHGAGVGDARHSMQAGCHGAGSGEPRQSSPSEGPVATTGEVNGRVSD